MSLQVVASKCEEAPNRFTKSVEEVTESLNTSVNSLLQHTISEMFNAVNQDCPHVLNHKVSWTRPCTVLRGIYCHKSEFWELSRVVPSLTDNSEALKKLREIEITSPTVSLAMKGFFSLLLPAKMLSLSSHWAFFSASMYFRQIYAQSSRLWFL